MRKFACYALLVATLVLLIPKGCGYLYGNRTLAVHGRVVDEAGAPVPSPDIHATVASQRWFQRRITVDDVQWAGTLLARLTDRQWHDAFRAGGYPTDVADRFIRKIRLNIEAAQSLGVEGP